MQAAVQAQTNTTPGDGIDSLIVCINKVSKDIPKLVERAAAFREKLLGLEFLRKPQAQDLVSELWRENEDFRAEVTLLEQRETDGYAGLQEIYETLHDALFPNYEQAMTLLNDNLLCNSFHYLLRDRLETELQTKARKRLLWQIDEAKKIHQETICELVKERNLHQNFKSQLQSEQISHQRTKSQLYQEQKQHTMTKSDLETIANGIYATQSQLQEQMEINQKVVSSLEMERKFHEKTKLQLEGQAKKLKEISVLLPREQTAQRERRLQLQKATEAHTQAQAQLEEFKLQLGSEQKAHLVTKSQLHEEQDAHEKMKSKYSETQSQMDEIQQAYQDNILQIEHEWRIKEKTLREFIKNLCSVPTPASCHHRHEAIEGATARTSGNYPVLRRSYSTREVSFQRRAVQRDSAVHLEEHHLAVERQQQISLTQQQAVVGRALPDAQYATEMPEHIAHQYQQCLRCSSTGYRTGPLKPAEYHAISKNFPGLVSNMPAEQVLDFLISARVINAQQRTKISSLSTDEEKGRLILDLVMRHPKGYAALIEALDSPLCGSDWLANQLRNDVEEFEKNEAEIYETRV